MSVDIANVSDPLREVRGEVGSTDFYLKISELSVQCLSLH